MTYVIVLKEREDAGWRAYQCPTSRFQFDAYEGCYRARKLAQMGCAEVQVVPIGAEGVFARFTRSVTGEVRQEGGVEL